MVKIIIIIYNTCVQAVVQKEKYFIDARIRIITKKMLHNNKK